MDYGALLTSRLREATPAPEPLGAMLLRKVRVETVNEFVDRMLDVLRKGDEEGHPFHGNQYVDGESGSEQSKDEDKAGEKEKSSHPGGVKGHVHELLMSGKPFSISELAQATGAKEERVKFLISRLQNPKYAPAGKVALTLEKQPDGKYKLAGTKEAAPKEPAQPKPVSAPKPPSAEKPAPNPKAAATAADTHTTGHSESAVGKGISAEYFVTSGQFEQEHGKFAQDNMKLNALITKDEGLGPGGWKDRVSKEIEQRLSNNHDWKKVTDFATKDHYGFGSSNGVASGLISVWAGTSGDHEPLAQAMQLAARDEFGLHSAEVKHMGIGVAHSEAHIWEKAAERVMGSSGTKTTYDPVSGGYKTTVDPNRPSMEQFKSAIRAFTRAEYANTQQWFADNGIKEVAVFRGMKVAGGAPQVVTLNGQPLSSFSTSLRTAAMFGKTIHMAVFPVSQVVGSCKTGRGCFNEKELVIMGKPTRAVRASREMFGGTDPSFHLATKVGKEAFFKHKGKG